MADNKITVMVADDDKLVGECVSLCLEQSGVVPGGFATSGRAAIEMALETKPDVILLDLLMPGTDPSQVMTTLRRRVPKTKVLIFSAWDRPEYLARAIVHGAAGYLTKEIGLDQLVQAIRGVAAGASGYSQSTVEAAIDVLSNVSGEGEAMGSPTAFAEERLTEQETRILTLLAEGLNNREIEVVLGLTGSTVKSHIGNILNKLQVHDRTKAAVWALQHDVVVR